MKHVFLGVDVGQSGVRAGVVDETGRLLAQQREYDPIRVETTSAGRRAEHDPRRWVDAMHRTVQQVLQACGPVTVAGVAIGSLGPAPVLVDSELRPLTPAVLYRLDERSADDRQALEETAGLQLGTLGADHARGIVDWWLRERSDLRPVWVLDVTGLLVAALTGEPVMDDVTYADYYDVPGLPTHPLLPRLMSGTEVAGRVTSDAAARTGLAIGTPVLAGSIDSLVDVHAAGLHRSGDGVIVYGSTGVVAVGVPDDQSAGHPLVKHLGRGQAAMDWTGSSGAAVNWLRGVLAEGGSLDDQVRAMSPGSGGVTVASQLAPAADGTVGGVIAGLTLATTPAELLRAMVDSVLVGLARIAWSFDDAGLVSGPWRGWGGGFSEAVTPQAMANALGRPLALPPSVGHVPGGAEFARQVMLDRPPPEHAAFLQPNAEQHRHYRQLAAQIDALTAPKESRA